MKSWIQLAVGGILALPSPEDVPTGGITNLVGLTMIADNFGVKIPILSGIYRGIF